MAANRRRLALRWARLGLRSSCESVAQTRPGQRAENVVAPSHRPGERHGRHYRTVRVSCAWAGFSLLPLRQRRAEYAMTAWPDLRAHAHAPRGPPGLRRAVLKSFVRRRFDPPACRSLAGVAAGRPSTPPGLASRYPAILPIQSRLKVFGRSCIPSVRVLCALWALGLIVAAMPSHDRLSLNASTTVMTPGTPFTVDVISSSGDVFLLNGILLMGTANGGNVVQTTITLNCMLHPLPLSAPNDSLA